MTSGELAQGNIGDVRFDATGLVPVVAQDALSGAVLMLAYADASALERTLATGEGHYYSRSRMGPWRKGETSGNVQRVIEVRYDCDGDALLYRVLQTGPACHTGAASCFYRTLSSAEAPVDAGPDIGAALDVLERVIADRLARLPEGSYVRRLHERGVGYVAQKVVEEAGETIVAALEQRDDELAGEAADLLFHLTVLLAERGVALSQIAATLLERHRDSRSPRA